MSVTNSGDAAVFFDQAQSQNVDALITEQLDPSQPQLKGLNTTTNPLVTDKHLSIRTRAFDPERFDLSDTSHLTKLISALLAGSGLGGVRRQQIIARMGVALSGTHFLELDGFWGALFYLSRSEEEKLPTTDAGTPIDPRVDVADSITWDTVQARDGRYRSRIEQLARGFASGGTFGGFKLAVRAVLNSEADVVESWVYADAQDANSTSFITNSWLAVSLQYPTWASLEGRNWQNLAFGGDIAIQTPLGNRSEVAIIPGRPITEVERMQLYDVLDKLAPAGVIVTIADSFFTTEDEVPIRSVYADSVDWMIVSLVTQSPSLPPDTDVYPVTSPVESGRPGFGRYTGERWSYNGQISSVDSYSIDDRRVVHGDYQTVTFSDGSAHAYSAGDALVDSKQLALARASSEGIMTTFPFVEDRGA